MNEEECKNIYQKYQELKEKTRLKAHRIEWSGEGVKPQSISPRDLEELDKTREELRGCFNFLSDDELIEISEDEDVGEQVKEILKKRRVYNSSKLCPGQPFDLAQGKQKN